VSEAMLDRPVGGATGTAPATDGDAPERRRHMTREAAIRALPRGELSEFQRAFRHRFSRTVSTLVMKTWFRITVVNPERFSRGPALYCFNHLSWMDTLLLIAMFPKQPRLYMYGPKQVDIRSGGKNRFMWWTGIPVPFSPNKDDLRTSVRRAQAVFDSGGVLAISGEGRIHVHEGELFPFEEGAAYLALRAGVPIIPVAISGTSWARFRGRVLLRLGEPIPTGERPTREAVARYTAWTWHAIRAMLDRDRDLPPPGPIGRWFTDWLNDWGPGGRAAAARQHGLDPADVPYGLPSGYAGSPAAPPVLSASRGPAAAGAGSPPSLSQAGSPAAGPLGSAEPASPHSGTPPAGSAQPASQPSDTPSPG
jgi:1-acyl-sn-glycerol-3-phosphate acyltransferase